MPYQLKSINFGYVLLTTTLLTIAAFSYYLLSESEAERLSRFYKTYDSLVLAGKIDEAQKLQSQVLAIGSDLPLDETWLPLVQAQRNGYDKLSNYLRILAGNTQREETYKEISELIAKAPDTFNRETKSIYIKELNELPFVERLFLKKYGLVEG